MKICFVYDAVYPWEPGGVQKRVWEIATRLSDRHDVHWFGAHYWDGPAVIERGGVRFHGVMDPRNLYVDERRSIFQALRYATHLATALPGNEFDVIDCQEFPYFPAFPTKAHSMVANSKLVLTWHEVWDEYWYEYLGKKGVCGKAIERLVARLPDEHVAVSRRTRREATAIGAATPHLVPNGIDLDEISSVTPAERSIDVLYTGRLIPEKGLDLLVRSVGQLTGRQWPDLSCLIVGEGPARKHLQRQIAEAGLGRNIDIVPFREDYEEVLALMKAATVFALPSRREGFGITALEALGCGTPVATIDHPSNAAKELIVDGRNGAVSDSCPESFAVALRRARGISSKPCIRTARTYDWDRIATRMERIYRDTL